MVTNRSLLIIALYFLIQGIRCGYGLRKARENLDLYESKTAELSYGSMTYVDAGEGEVILSVHGIFGGYDQAYDSVKSRKSQNRLLAPSRFGYLGSDVKGDGTPSEQAAAFAELLDCLGIEKVFILGTSAGGTPAIRFALDYPERVKGLILFCSAMPVPENRRLFLNIRRLPNLCSQTMRCINQSANASSDGNAGFNGESIQPVSERKSELFWTASLRIRIWKETSSSIPSKS